MTQPTFPPVSEDDRDERVHRKRIAQMVNRINQGKFNAVFVTFTLTANASSTTLTDPRIGYYSFIGLMPMTADAAAALSGLWFSQPVTGSVVVNHANDANSDKTFNVLIIG